MSVFILSPEEFGAIAATLRIARDSFHRPLFPLSMEERWEHKAIAEPCTQQTEEDFTLSRIDPFVYRLYLANVIAERYTYLKDGTTEIVIPLIDLPKSRPVNLPTLRRMLSSLSYNLVTNGGNTFLGVKDDQKLERLRAVINDKLAQAKDA